MASHLPWLWKFRLLRAIRAKGNRTNRRLLQAWARAEGGTARNNPLNTTQPWPGATDYNPQGVKNYPNGSAGITATAITLTNGHYDGLLADLRMGCKTAEQVVTDRRAEISVWGTNPDIILSVLHG